MKRILPLALCICLLWGCAPAEQPADGSTITLSDEGITVPEGVELGGEIIYYEDRLTYDSGNPYGEGMESERHTAEEAAAHTQVKITQPGSYTVTGKLSAGQICVDLGEDAKDDPGAVVYLTLKDADITCTIAPAILFLNVYECDPDRNEDNATPNVDTGKAGANLILEGENHVSGSYVARIYKDKEGEKKLWKQDGAIYSYMSMNVYGTGGLTLTAENEGLDTERHLTIDSGDIIIYAQNDGINTNEDGVSVTTINGGSVDIYAGLGAEGDGIDSNGYLVINGGTVFASAHPAADAGLDSDLGSFIHGGYVIALGSTMDWAETDSGQVTMNLQFAQRQSGAETLEVRREDGTVLLKVPAQERQYQGAILSCPDFRQGEIYEVFAKDVQMAYTGTDVGGIRPGGPGGFPGGQGMQMPGGQQGEPPEMPEGGFQGQMPGGERPEWPDDEVPEMPAGEGPGEEGKPQDGMTPPEGEPGGFGQSMTAGGEGSTSFFMADLVNFFSGVGAAE